MMKQTALAPFNLSHPVCLYLILFLGNSAPNNGMTLKCALAVIQGN